MLVVTRGEHGCVADDRERPRSTCPRCRRDRIVDPTGVGDAFRGGFMKGLVAGADLETCGRLGSVAADLRARALGGTSHAYTWEEFAARYEEHFGPLERWPSD